MPTNYYTLDNEAFYSSVNLLMGLCLMGNCLRKEISRPLSGMKTIQSPSWLPNCLMAWVYVKLIFSSSWSTRMEHWALYVYTVVVFTLQWSQYKR